jgi:hypothetical protein
MQSSKAVEAEKGSPEAVELEDDAALPLALTRMENLRTKKNEFSLLARVGGGGPMAPANGDMRLDCRATWRAQSLQESSLARAAAPGTDLQRGDSA